MKYKIKGDTLPVLIIDLDQGEKIITEAGAMSWMSENMIMQTTSGTVNKVIGRVLSGETMFQNVYEASSKEGMIALASKFPGSIKALEINGEKSIIIQKRSFLACEVGVIHSLYFQKNLGVGLLGGEGFIMQRLSGKGLAFIEVDGFAIEYDLKDNEKMIVDTHHLVAMDSSCTIDIRTIGSVKNIFGGEGLFNTVITGPGKLTLQTMPIWKLFRSKNRRPNVI